MSRRSMENVSARQIIIDLTETVIMSQKYTVQRTCVLLKCFQLRSFIVAMHLRLTSLVRTTERN
jgi:hypothetical protein